MMEDAVLRCLIAVKLDGIVMSQLLDAVSEGEFYKIVLEWGEVDGAGRSPRQYVMMPKSQFQAVSSITADHELICHTGIDLDAATTTDLPEAPTRFFQNPPQ